MFWTFQGCHWYSSPLYYIKLSYTKHLLNYCVTFIEYLKQNCLFCDKCTVTCVCEAVVHTILCGNRTGTLYPLKLSVMFSKHSPWWSKKACHGIVFLRFVIALAESTSNHIFTCKHINSIMNSSNPCMLLQRIFVLARRHCYSMAFVWEHLIPNVKVSLWHGQPAKCHRFAHHTQHI